jgi:hypothetical protein
MHPAISPVQQDNSPVALFVQHPVLTHNPTVLTEIAHRGNISKHFNPRLRIPAIAIEKAYSDEHQYE